MLKLPHRLASTRTRVQVARRFVQTARARSEEPNLWLGNINITEEDRTAIPNVPDLSPVPRLRESIVRPQDICEVFLYPTFEDLLVCILSENGNLAGNTKYTPVCKGEAKSTNLRFTKMALSWVNELKLLEQDLADISQPNILNAFTSERTDRAIAEILDPDSLTSAENTLKFFDACTRSEPTIPIENVVALLVMTSAVASDFQKYAHIVLYLSNHWEKVDSRLVDGLLLLLLNDVEASQSVEKRQTFIDCVHGSLMTHFPDCLHTLDPYIVDKVALFLLESSHRTAASELMQILIHSRDTSPSRETFKKFISVYMRKVQQAKLTKAEILADIAPFKVLFLRFGLDADAFELILSNVIDNSYDLSQFIRLALRTNSAELLSEYAEQVILRLHHIQRAQDDSPTMKAVQLNQLFRFLVEKNDLVVSEKILSLMRRLYNELGVEFDEPITG